MRPLQARRTYFALTILLLDWLDHWCLGDDDSPSLKDGCSRLDTDRATLHGVPSIFGARA